MKSLKWSRKASKPRTKQNRSPRMRKKMRMCLRKTSRPNKKANSTLMTKKKRTKPNEKELKRKKRN
jgi:hypothetical protein